MTKREKALFLFESLKKTDISGIHNAPYGVRIEEIMGMKGEKYEYLNFEYACFIIYLVNNFKEIIEIKDEK